MLLRNLAFKVVTSRVVRYILRRICGSYRVHRVMLHRLSLGWSYVRRIIVTALSS
jgi:hypothetical protein